MCTYVHVHVFLLALLVIQRQPVAASTCSAKESQYLDVNLDFNLMRDETRQSARAMDWQLLVSE